MEQIIANLLNDFERGRMSRRQLVQTLAAGIAAATATPALAAGPTKLKAISVNHMSWRCRITPKRATFMPTCWA